MKKLHALSALMITQFYGFSAFAQTTGWEKPIISKLEGLQVGIIALGVVIALLAFIVGIIKSIFGRGGFDSWKLPLTAVAVGILVALAPTLFLSLTSIAS